jgi:hypothetical protein
MCGAMGFFALVFSFLVAIESALTEIEPAISLTPARISLQSVLDDPTNSLRLISGDDFETMASVDVPNNGTGFFEIMTATNRRRLLDSRSSDRRRLSTLSHSYSYTCEAMTKCHLPKASGFDYWDSHIQVTEKDYELKDGSVVQIDHCCDTSKPSNYEVLYDAIDKAGNKAQQVTIELAVIGKC